MAKRFTHQIGGSRITLDLYTDDVHDAMLENIKANLEPVAQAMEAEAKRLCPVGTVQKLSDILAWGIISG